ncbi:hypothetical protein ACFLTH_05940 [Bacteroidota bacterium]
MCQDKITLDAVDSKFQSLEYRRVIEVVDSLLLLDEITDDESKINLLVWKGVSHYSLGENDKTRKCFVEILKLDRDYILDPVIISPKIINYFNLVREEFLDIAPPKQDDITEETLPPPLKIDAVKYKNAVARSLILPGWGHLYSSQTTKGWILTTASAVSAVSMIYFIFNTNSKEKEYLSVSDPVLIQQKYDDYNTSYKIRNAAIISFAAIWLYSQIDMLFFSDEHFIEQVPLEITANNDFNLPSQFNISFRVAF